MDNKWVIVAGNLNDGYKLYGPYETFKEAEKASNEINEPSWITKIYKEIALP